MILGLAARTLLRHRTRALMGTLGVLVTILLLTVLAVGLESVALSSVELMSRSSGKADLLVRERKGYWLDPGFYPAEAALAALRSTEGIAGATPRIITRITAGGQAVTLIGLEPEAEQALGLADVTPWPELGEGRCALSRPLAALFPNGEIPLAGEHLAAPATLRCTAIVDKQQLMLQILPHFVVVDRATAERLVGRPGEATILAARFEDAASYYDARSLSASLARARELGRRVAARLEPRLDASLPRVAALVRFSSVEAPLAAVFGVLAAVLLGITAFLLHSLLTIGAEERVRDHAILRSLGGKRRHVFGLVVAEAAWMCVFGVLPGVLLGVLAAHGIARFGGRLFALGNVAVPIVVSFETVRLALVGGVVITLASSVLPGLAATRAGIVDGLDPLRRGALPQPASEASPRGRLVVGGLSVAVSSALVFFLLPAAYLTGDVGLMGSAAVVLLLVMLAGFAFAGLGLLPLLRRLVARLLAGLGETPIAFAERNVARYERRYFASSILLTVATAFVLFAGSLVAFYDESKLDFLERQMGADVRVTMTRPDKLDATAELSAMPEVASFARVTTAKPVSDEGFANSVIAADLIDSEPLTVGLYGVEPPFFDTIFAHQVRCEEGGAEDLRAISDDPGVAREDGAIPAAVSLSIARYLDVHRGDQLRLSLRLGGTRGEARVRIVAVCSRIPSLLAFRGRLVNPTGSGVLVAQKSYDVLTASVPKDAFQGLYLARAAAAEPSAAAAAIRNTLCTTHGAVVAVAAEERALAEDIYVASQAIGALLLALSLAIAAFGLVAAMAATVLERRFELGVLGALGMRRSALFRMLAAESLLLTFSSSALGCGVGYLLAYLFAAQTTSLYEVDVVLAVPWPLLGATFVLSAVVGVVAAWVPARAILRRPVSESLAS